MIGEMSRIVRTMTNIIFGFIVVFGFYVIAHGHLSPGGGFQGGAIVASAFALLLVTYGTEVIQQYIAKDLLSVIESTGLILFGSFGFLGISATYFYNIVANSGGLFGSPTVIGVNPGDLNTSGTIALMNIAVGLEVLAALGVIVLTMSAAAEIIQNKEKS